MADKARDDIKDMADKMAKQTSQMADKVRDDAKEMAKMAIAEREKAAVIEEKKAPPKIAEVTIVPRTAPGWIVRLCVLALILRWRPLFRLVGRLALMVAK